MTTLRELLSAAGFQGQALDTAAAIATAESGDNAHAFNGNVHTGDQSYGLFQINMLGGMGPQRRAAYGLASNDQLYDPATNARVAYALSNHGTDFSAWSTYKDGAYKSFLGNAADRQVTDSGHPVGVSNTALPNGLPAGVGAAGQALSGLTSGWSSDAQKIGLYVVVLAVGGALVVAGLNKATGGAIGKAAGAAASHMPAVIPV